MHSSRLSALGFQLIAVSLIACSAESREPRTDSAVSREPRAESTATESSVSREPRAESTVAENPDCGADQPLLTGTGIGHLRIGATVASIKSRCMVLRDTTVPGVEGQPERRMTVLVAGTNTVTTVVDDKVWRIEIGSPRFMTRDSLGVGSNVGRLRSPKARLALGEGAFVLRTDHCGLSFKLSSGVGAFGGDLASVPDSTQVRTVLVTGC